MMKMRNQDGSPVTLEQLEEMVPPLRKFTVTYIDAKTEEIVTREVLAHKDSSTQFGMLIFTRLYLDRLNTALHERTVWGVMGVLDYAEDPDYVDTSKSSLATPSLKDRLRFN